MNDDKVVSISGSPVPAAAQPNPSLILMLKHALTLAESGELQTIMAAGLYANGISYQLRGPLVPGMNAHTLLGSLYFLASDFEMSVRGSMNMREV